MRWAGGSVRARRTTRDSTVTSVEVLSMDSPTAIPVTAAALVRPAKSVMSTLDSVTASAASEDRRVTAASTVISTIQRVNVS